MNHTWLDTETKAVLQKVPPEKFAPATTETFSIVVIDCSFRPNRSRQLRAFHRVLGTTIDHANHYLKRTIPLVLKRKLSLSDALLAQFELICCDLVSVFVSDSVISNADPNYLAGLWNSLKTGEEFEIQSVTINSVPDDSSGEDFLVQFVGAKDANFPVHMRAMRKKARIMHHWANKIGAAILVADR